MDLVLPAGITFIFFSAMAVATLAQSSKRADFLSRNAGAWWIDSVSLLTQGLVIPALQTLLLAQLWIWLWPGLEGALPLSGIVAFLLSFVGVDYLYYWNHRLLHHRALWKWHALHHSVERMDFYVTSRNSLLTPLLIVYVWINSLIIFFTGDSLWFVATVALGAGLDLWRHSGFSLHPSGMPYKIFSPWLTLPQDHSWHHAEGKPCNFAANLILWDKLHGTSYRPQVQPTRWGGGATINWRNFILPEGEPHDSRR